MSSTVTNEIIANAITIAINSNSVETKYIHNLVNHYPDILQNYIFQNICPDLSNVPYVKEKRYIQIKNKVLNKKNLLLLFEMFDYNLNMKMLKQIYDKLIDYDIDDLKLFIYNSICEDPYVFISNHVNLSLMEIDKNLLSAYKINPNIFGYDIENSNKRIVAYVRFCLYNHSNGSTSMPINSITQILHNKYQIYFLPEYFIDAIQCDIFKINGDNISLYTDYIQENNIACFIKDGLSHIDYWDIDINNYRNLNNCKLTNMQLSVLESINNNQITLLNGYAGCGKSLSVKAITNMLEDNNKTYKLLSPTAKAAKQLSDYTHRVASTIHYLIFCECFDSNVEIDLLDLENTNVDAYKNFKSHNILDYDVLIIDESSMLSISLFNLLIKFIDIRKTKLVLIGDSYQLPSIQRGNLYQDLLDIKEISKITLDKIFRYTENGLTYVASNVRMSKPFLSLGDSTNIQHFGKSYEFHKCDTIPELLNSALNLFLDLANKGYGKEDVVVLTAKNVGDTGTYMINNLLQEALNPLNDGMDELQITVNKQIIKFRPNDRIMNIKNNYELKPISSNSDSYYMLTNGQTGIIQSIDMENETMVVDFDGSLYLLDNEYFENLRLAYAFTIHKAQGSQFKNVIYITSTQDNFMTTSNLLYVAITRAQEHCYHFGSIHTINSGLYKKENLQRQTQLVNLFYEIA